MNASLCLRCKIRVGFSGRQRQMESVRAYECAAAFQQKQQEIAGRLELLKRRFARMFWKP